MAKELRIKTALKSICVLISLSAVQLFSQTTENQDSVSEVSDMVIPTSIYAAAMKQMCSDSFYWGIFDSTDSYFLVRLCDWRQSPFDSSAFYSYGKTMHKSQIVNNTAYLDINSIDVVHYEITQDSLEEDIRLNSLWDSIEKTGGYLVQMNAEYFINEDPQANYSGTFSGLLSYHFMFFPKNNKIQHVPSAWLPYEMPSVIFQGFWRLNKSNSTASIPYYWGNKAPVKKRNGQMELPDLRFMSDGSSSITNTAIFQEDVLYPDLNWYK